jgi:hypothetical protein
MKENVIALSTKWAFHCRQAPLYQGAMLHSFSGQNTKQPVPSILRADTPSKDADFSELQIPQPKCTASHL